MIPVHQTLFGEEGNCLVACIASIFEIPLESIPHFALEPRWRESLNKFLKLYNVTTITVRFDEAEGFPQSYMIICGKTNPERWHATVGFAGKIIHDPMPGGTKFIDDHIEYELFLTIDPSRKLC